MSRSLVKSLSLLVLRLLFSDPFFSFLSREFNPPEMVGKPSGPSFTSNDILFNPFSDCDSVDVEVLTDEGSELVPEAMIMISFA